MTRLAPLLLLLFAGCQRAKAPPAAVLRVPPAAGAVTIDGDLDDPAWPAALHSPAFEDARGGRAPFTDLSVMADGDTLYLSVYVADEDLRSSADRLVVSMGPLQLVLTPGGAKVVPAGVRVGTDVDGLLDDAQEDDEEWVSEIAIPRALLPAGPVPLHVLRVDAGRGGRPHALAWPRTSSALLDLSAVQGAVPRLGG